MPKLTGLIEMMEDLRNYAIEYRIHATRRMFERNIDENDVERTLKQGEVIERYDEDFPLPSVLISGRTTGGRPLHVVVGINTPERKFIIITVYEPDPPRWTKDFSRRKT
uniref:DUF4258 domain-containing protein n=1 Tax=Candidatus Kentrum sp. FW TaxID=2126338 RepID=A0A450U2Z3_9GAMM|nr:MAG: protein of unknown function (DUF4258) [Candidatus Kentron sp. FW]